MAFELAEKALGERDNGGRWWEKWNNQLRGNQAAWKTITQTNSMNNRITCSKLRLTKFPAKVKQTNGNRRKQIILHSFSFYWSCISTLLNSFRFVSLVQFDQNLFRLQYFTRSFFQFTRRLCVCACAFALRIRFNDGFVGKEHQRMKLTTVNSMYHD